MKPRHLFFLALFFIFSAGFGVAGAPPGHPITLAHRGANLEEDEDTLAAYRRAADYGVDMVETDPRLTADGHWIVMHDPKVDRTTNGHGLVARMTLAEIKTLRTVPRGEQVPTLEEVLDFAFSRKTGVYLDMKNIPPNWATFVNILERHHMKDKVIMGIWWKASERELESRWPELVTCISWPKPVVTLEGVKELGADYVGTLNRFATPGMIRKAHRLGLKVVTMPIDSASELEKFRARGLDILQTNDPRLLKALKLSIIPKALGLTPNKVVYEKDRGYNQAFQTR